MLPTRFFEISISLRPRSAVFNYRNSIQSIWGPNLVSALLRPLLVIHQLAVRLKATDVYNSSINCDETEGSMLWPIRGKLLATEGTPLCNRRQCRAQVVEIIKQTLCNKNQLDALFILSLFRQSSSACFGHICSPSSGGILNRIEQNGMWVRAFPGPVDLRLILTGPVCPVFYTKLKEPCCKGPRVLYQIKRALLQRAPCSIPN